MLDWRASAVAACRLFDVGLKFGVAMSAEEGSRQLGPSTRQAVLVALSTLGTALGPSHPTPFLHALPAMVAAAQDVHRSVRGSALAAAAACLAALGSQALPLLPKLVPALLTAAQAAVNGLASPSEDQVCLWPCWNSSWSNPAASSGLYPFCM